MKYNQSKFNPGRIEEFYVIHEELGKYATTITDTTATIAVLHNTYISLDQTVAHFYSIFLIF